MRDLVRPGSNLHGSITSSRSISGCIAHPLEITLCIRLVFHCKLRVGTKESIVDCGFPFCMVQRERSGQRSSMMMGTELCSSRMLSLPRHESGDEELSVLPRHTKVIVTGNNRTKSVLVGLQGVVKKAVGLGGWHWLVLKNGIEVKLQRNALSVLEAPTGNEDDDEIDGNNSFCSSSDMGEKDMDYSSIEYQKPTKPRVRHTRPWSSCTKTSSRGDFHSGSKLRTRVNLTKLGTPTLWRYWKQFNLVSMNPNPSKEQLFHGVQQHFQSQQLDELQVILGFIQTAKRLKTLYNS